VMDLPRPMGYGLEVLPIQVAWAMAACQMSPASAA
jgi:hypothetical protein